MEKGIYTFAGTPVELVTRYGETHRRCAAYRCGGPPAFSVQAAPEDIARIQATMRTADGDLYTDDAAEFCAVLPLLEAQLLARDVLLFHASAVAMDGAAYLFAAKSGTGKSTHTGYWRACFGARAVMINDDKPFLHVTPRGVTVYGSPWCGKHHLNNNLSAPVRGLCLLERAGKDFIEPLTPAQAFPALYRQTCLMEDRAGRLRQLALVDQLSKAVPLYRLGATMSPAAARVAWAGMNGGL